MYGVKTVIFPDDLNLFVVVNGRGEPAYMPHSLQVLAFTSKPQAEQYLKMGIGARIDRFCRIAVNERAENNLNAKEKN